MPSATSEPTAKEVLRTLRQWERTVSDDRAANQERAENSSVARRRRNNEGLHPALRGLKSRLPLVEARLKACEPHARVRMTVVFAGLQGKSVETIADENNVWKAQVVKWFRDFRGSEIAAFEAMEAHRPARITYATFDEFREALCEGVVRTPTQAKAWLESRSGTSFHRATVFRYLRKAAPKHARGGRAKK